VYFDHINISPTKLAKTTEAAKYKANLILFFSVLFRSFSFFSKKNDEMGDFCT